MKASVKWLALFTSLQGMLLFCEGRIVASRENPDGEFGPATEKAVKSFQHLKALEADGVIGAVTWKALLMT